MCAGSVISICAGMGSPSPATFSRYGARVWFSRQRYSALISGSPCWTVIRFQSCGRPPYSRTSSTVSSAGIVISTRAMLLSSYPVRTAATSSPLARADWIS